MSRLLNEWAQARGVPIKADGRVTVLVDRAYRVHLFASHDGRLIIESRICALPTNIREAEDRITHALHFSLVRMRESACSVVVDKDKKNLQLQYSTSRNPSLKELDQALEAFMRELSVWLEEI